MDIHNSLLCINAYLKITSFLKIINYTYFPNRNKLLILNYSYPWMENALVNRMHICIQGLFKHMSSYVHLFF